jgi:transcriptional regulator with XRE-family HTH domain
MASQRLSGPRLLAKRVECGLSRPGAALAAARSVESLALYERGRISPPVAVLERLAAAYGCELADFFDQVADDAPAR